MPSFAYILRSPLLPQHLIALTAVLAMLALAVYVRNMRRQPLVSTFLLLMRWSVIAVLTWLLTGPSELPPAPPQEAKQPLHIYLDGSASMLTPDVQGKARLRFAIERWLGEDRLRRLNERYDVQLFTLDQAVLPLSGRDLKMDDAELARGRTSPLAQSLTQEVLALSAGAKSPVILVLSDGHDSLGEPLAQVGSLAKARGTVIHAATFGGVTAQQDIALSASLSQRFLIVKEPGAISVRIRRTGSELPMTQLHVRQGGETTTQPVDFRGQREVEITLPIRHDEPGVYEYELSVEPLPGEFEKGNNSRTLFAEVTGQRIQVLMLEGEPYWDTKFLAQSLRKDASVALTHITQMTDSRQSKIVTRGPEDAVAAVPQTAQDWARYNVVILGRGLERLLSPEQAALLPAFVSEHGGHVIMARGQAYDPTTREGEALSQRWSLLEPVVWSRSGALLHDFAWEPTPAGLNEPCFMLDSLGLSAQRALPSIKAYSAMPAIERVKPTALVLAQAIPYGTADDSLLTARGTQPALVRMQVGSGQVVALLGEGLWHWSQLPPRFKQFDGMYDLFWSNLVRSLAMGSRFQPDQDVSLEVSSPSDRLGDPVTITVITRTVPREYDYLPKIRVTDPAGQVHEPAVRKLTGGTRYQATFKPQLPGVHAVQLDAAPLKPSPQERRFSVYFEDIERLESSADPTAMRQMAQLSGGRHFTPDEADELPAHLARSLAASEGAKEPEYVWNRGFILALLLTWTGLEWLARRGAGLL